MPNLHQGPPREVRALDCFVKLVRATDTLGALLGRGLAAHGLTSGQLAVLEAIHHHGGMHQRILAKKLQRTEANVTGVVQALERAGLVRRVRGDPDKRLRVVWLTREGKRVLDKVFPPHVQRVADSLGVLSPREQAELGRLCRKLGLALRKADGDEASDLKG
jgi:MarR family 2-MHQ and catechol resistance regulon transcriptional repressor